MRKLAAVVLMLGAFGALAADPDALWKIVEGKCVPAAQAGNQPKPCLSVDFARGVAVLKDLNGEYQFLAIPTARISGIEDDAVSADRSFEIAWEARTAVEARLGRTLPRDAVSLAVNSANGRSQNQLHVHIDCLDATVRTAIAGAAIGEDWVPFPALLAGHRYIARRVHGETLAGINPFKLLAAKIGGPMGSWTLVVVGAPQSGFVLLAGNDDLAHGEDLQDHTCRGY